MDEQFLKALQSVDMSNPTNHVAAIRALFTHINSLDAPQIMAAYQTFEYFYERIEKRLDTNARNNLFNLSPPMVTRMIYLCSIAPADSRKILAQAFLEALGDHATTYFIPFRQAGLI